MENYNEMIEILDYEGEGYAPVMTYAGWRVAVINFRESLTLENFHSMEKHTETDEVFIPITGESTLFIGEDRKAFPLEIGKIYNVKRAVWHHICMSPDAKVAVVEQDSTCKDNTLRMEF